MLKCIKEKEKKLISLMWGIVLVKIFAESHWEWTYLKARLLIVWIKCYLLKNCSPTSNVREKATSIMFRGNEKCACFLHFSYHWAIGTISWVNPKWCPVKCVQLIRYRSVFYARIWKCAIVHIIRCYFCCPRMWPLISTCDFFDCDLLVHFPFT